MTILLDNLYSALYRNDGTSLQAHLEALTPSDFSMLKKHDVIHDMLHIAAASGLDNTLPVLLRYNKKTFNLKSALVKALKLQCKPALEGLLSTHPNAQHELVHAAAGIANTDDIKPLQFLIDNASIDTVQGLLTNLSFMQVINKRIPAILQITESEKTSVCVLLKEHFHKLYDAFMQIPDKMIYDATFKFVALTGFCCDSDDVVEKITQVTKRYLKQPKLHSVIENNYSHVANDASKTLLSSLSKRILQKKDIKQNICEVLANTLLLIEARGTFKREPDILLNFLIKIHAYAFFTDDQQNTTLTPDPGFCNTELAKQGFIKLLNLYEKYSAPDAVFSWILANYPIMLGRAPIDQWQQKQVIDCLHRVMPRVDKAEVSELLGMTENDLNEILLQKPAINNLFQNESTIQVLLMWMDVILSNPKNNPNTAVNHLLSNDSGQRRAHAVYALMTLPLETLFEDGVMHSPVSIGFLSSRYSFTTLLEYAHSHAQARNIILDMMHQENSERRDC